MALDAAGSILLVVSKSVAPFVVCSWQGVRSLVLQADFSNHLIRRVVVSSGNVTTLAGVAGAPGRLNGIGTLAFFNNPIGVTMDAAGTIAIVVSQE